MKTDMMQIMGDSTPAEKTDDYVITVNDMGKCLLMNASSLKSFTLPEGMPVGSRIMLVKLGSGAVAILKSGSDTIMDGEALTNSTTETRANVTLFKYSSTGWLITSGFGTWVTS